MDLLTFKKGIHPKYNKEFCNGSVITHMAPPDVAVIPLVQHIGAPCKSLVSKGDDVKVGQKVGEADAFVTSPIHASISGKVTHVEPRLHPSGVLMRSIVIKSDEKDELHESLGESKNISSLSPQEISNIIKNAGIVGLGGAAFPTHIKLNPPKEKKIDAVILNGAECEPYLTCDHRVMLEYPSDILFGLKAFMKAVGVKKGYIGIENNKKDAIRAFRNVLKNDNNGNLIKIVPLEVKYPQGAEKMLIYAILGREVPSGGLPMDVGAVVQNVGTAIAVSNAVKYSRPLIERVLTVTGSGIKEPKNLLVRLGTSINTVIAECGGLLSETGKVLMGGPMMGLALSSLDVPIVKGTSGILALSKKDMVIEKSRACIGCGKCTDVCPMLLLPTTIAAFAEHDKQDKAEKTGIMDCIECGCCTFICPSKRHLVQLIRLGKGKIMAKKRGTKK